MNAIRALRARRILTPADAPSAAQRNNLSVPLDVLENAVIIFGGGIIHAVEPFARFKRHSGIPLEDAGEASLVPGLINAHCHAEFASLRGLTLLGSGFCAWAESLLTLKDQGLKQEDVVRSIGEMAGTGVVHAANICSRAPVFSAGAFFESGISVDLFLESFGFHLLPTQPPPADAEELRQRLLGTPSRLASHCALSGHALYSTAPRTLQLARQDCARRAKTFTMHLAEHEDEMECLLRGSGAFHDLLTRRGVLPAGLPAPGKRPVILAHELNLLGHGTLAVHCVHCNAGEAALLAETGTAVCLCPRSNALINAGGIAPVRHFIDSGVLLCLGTDSLASNTDLNLWNEARALRDMCELPDAALLRMLTVNAAQALRRPELGRIAPGYRAVWSELPQDFRPQ